MCKAAFRRLHFVKLCCHSDPIGFWQCRFKAGIYPSFGGYPYIVGFCYLSKFLFSHLKIFIVFFSLDSQLYYDLVSKFEFLPQKQLELRIILLSFWNRFFFFVVYKWQISVKSFKTWVILSPPIVGTVFSCWDYHFISLAGRSFSVWFGG